jgi:hypothetical protein
MYKHLDEPLPVIDSLLAAAADDWQRGHQDDSCLLRGARLKQIEEWAAETELVLTQHERHFLRVCVAERDRQEAAERERQAREAALKQRAQRVLQLLMGVFLLADRGTANQPCNWF